MLKNINDLLSLFSIILMLVFSLKFFFGLAFSEQNSDENISRYSLLKDYLNNEDE